MAGNLRESLTDCIDKILEIREDLGVQLADVYIVNRRWSGERVGDGTFGDVVSQVKPTPGIKDYSHNIRVTEVGAVKAGDIILSGISRNQYPDELEFKTKTEERNTQRMFKVGKHFYHVVTVVEKLLTWDVHLRKIRQDETEER